MNKFITFEGIDACGKTTQIELLSEYLNSIKEENIIVREPGGTSISEEIRKILLDEKNDISSYTETLLFLSSRSQLINEVIKKNINKRKFILCDRFTDSTLAYQGYGRGLDIGLLNSLNDFATENIKPDITFILDVSTEQSSERMNKRDIDRMEQSGIDFLNRVKEGYVKIAQQNKTRYVLLDCLDKSIELIKNEIIETVNSLYGIDK